MKKWECTVCGYIHEGDEPPDECPVCAADKSMFVEVVEQAAAAEPAATAEPAASPAAPAQPAGKQGLPATLLAFATTQILRHHLHPIMVHTPNGIVPMAVIFLFIAALFTAPLFDIAALYSLVFVLVAMPAVLATGYIVWQERYRGALTSIFKLKIGASIVATVSLVILLIWRALQPAVLTTPSTGRWFFLILAVIMVGAVGLAGHMGGKLVFGNRKY
ncbi:rubredoxin-like domain-containing protein [uncultured Desulfobulbus sp.]|uniref:rubredoxin-like domain-containing protein n=1 Tax=uncultured Desulfobulbus sp. TaxID=239745 RepID=UPI0026302FC1|nr:DUF2231 domain-containing protein [uncultured Desulfobulbus sp.]